MPISLPPKITTPWATSGLKNSIPPAADPINGLAGYDQGFPAINMTPKTAGGIPPFGQDFNGVFFDITKAVQFLEAGGSFPYDSAWASAVGGYPVGAIVSRTDNSGFWRNTLPNNTSDPESGGTGWQPEGSGATSVAMASSNVTLTSLQAARATIVITGTLTANLQLVFPTYQKQWLVVNSATGNFSVTCKTSAGSGISVPAGSNAQIYGNGTDIKSVVSQVSLLPKGYRDGFLMANNVSAPNTTVDVAEGSARSSDNLVDINLTSTLRGIIQTSGAWAAGDNQNKLDAGVRTANTWYHIYAIRRASDGVADILASTSPTSPTIPSGYSGFFLIESVLTDGSNNIVQFLNLADSMYWKSARLDVVLGTTAPGNSTVTVSTPLGRRVLVKQHAGVSANSPVIYTHSPDTNNETLGTFGAGTYTVGISTNDPAATADPIAGYLECPTNLTSNVSLQTAAFTGSMFVVQLATLGWRRL